jgi:gliding motility-associated-like protein
MQKIITYKFTYAVLLFWMLLHTSIVQAQIIYVDSANVSGTHNGTSWATAYNDFQAGVNAANAGDTIWVAKGTYQPAFDSSFSMKNDVKIYGGFSDTATVFSSHNWKINTTVLLGNDSIVISNLNLDATSLLDGFIITGGRISHNGIGLGYGGAGMLNNTSSPILADLVFSDDVAIGAGGGGGGMLNIGSSPTLTNVIFSNDSAGGSGGGMFNDGGAPVLTNVTFLHTAAGVQGGGMLNEASSPILTNVIFQDNTAITGGGMANYACSPVLINTVFYNDTAITNGGGILDGGASPVLINATFYQNDAANGGGIMNSGQCSVVITNSVFWANTATAAGSDIYDNIDPNMPTIVSYSFTQTAIPGTGNIQGIADPFVNDANPAGPDGIWMTPDDGLELKGCINNPAINAGNNTANTTAADATGQPRIVNSIIDIGAYEYQNLPVQLSITSPVAVCAPNTVDLTATSVTSGSTTGMSFSYYMDSAATRVLANPDKVNVSGLYYIVGTINGACTSDTGSVTATIVQPLVFDLGNTLSMCKGQVIVLAPALSGPVTYLWQDGSNGTAFNVTDTGTYTLTATNTCGSYTNSVTVNSGACELYMPSAFSPNKDGVNDVFRVKYPFATQAFDFIIYNRWGEKVFETTYMSAGWDGAYQNNDQPMDNYVWIITYTDMEGNKKIARGSVLLMR